MSLANAGALWWLLPLGGIIILLYLLKMRRRDLTVPATFLWPNMTTEVRANSLFQRLRFSWLLLLQILALLLIIAALARPQTRQKGLAGSITVFVLDTSASMAATDVGKSRFDEALRIIRQNVDSARPEDRFSLIEAGPSPRVVFPLSNDGAKIRTALNTVEQTDAVCDAGEALRLAAALVGSETSGRIVLLSDGAFPEVDNFSPGKAAVYFQKIGKSAENIAITALGAGDTPAGKQLFCGIKNYGSQSRTIPISFYADGSLYDSRKITLSAAGSIGQTAKVPIGAKVLEARIDTNDYLKSDDAATALADPSSSIRVLLVGSGDIFLERALALDPRVTLDKAISVPSTEMANADGQGSYDVVVFDGMRETPVKARGVLTFGAAGPASPVTESGSIQKPVFKSESTDHPLMRYVDMHATYIGTAERATPKPGADVLAESESGPLIVASETGKRQVYVAFSPLQSDFPLQIGFPIFISNALDFIVGRATSNTLVVRPGKPISFPATTSANGNLVSPDGARSAVEPSGGSYILRNVTRAGKYLFDVAGTKRTLYASLLDEKESAIQPQDNVDFSGGMVRPSTSPARIADFWRPLLLVCLLVLTIEWWVFAKRS